MKNSVNPAVFVVAIVAVIAVACFFGIRALVPDHSKEATAVPAKMTSDQQAQYEAMRAGRSGSSGMNGSSGMHGGSGGPMSGGGSGGPMGGSSGGH